MVYWKGIKMDRMVALLDDKLQNLRFNVTMVDREDVSNDMSDG